MGFRALPAQSSLGFCGIKRECTGRTGVILNFQSSGSSRRNGEAHGDPPGGLGYSVTCSTCRECAREQQEVTPVTKPRHSSKVYPEPGIQDQPGHDPALKHNPGVLLDAESPLCPRAGPSTVRHSRSHTGDPNPFPNA